MCEKKILMFLLYIFRSQVKYVFATAQHLDLDEWFSRKCTENFLGKNNNTKKNIKS